MARDSRRAKQIEDLTWEEAEKLLQEHVDVILYRPSTIQTGYRREQIILLLDHLKVLKLEEEA